MEELPAAEIASADVELKFYEDNGGTSIPKYLEDTYWWAYLHPKGVRLFERQWLVNLILWGNFIRLRDVALDELGEVIRGHTLQVACVYGDFTPQLADRRSPGTRLDLIDVARVQLENAKEKLDGYKNIFLHHQDANNLLFPDGTFTNTVVFFLLHEQPLDVRIRTIKEALRVTKPGGKVVIVDYHRPVRSNPFRYIMVPILRTLEPFALDLWKNEISDWLPDDIQPRKIEKETYFGDLYQKVVITR